MNSLQHKGSNMNALKHSLIWFFLILLCGLPISFLAFGSDIQTQHSSLYPYRSTVELQDEFIFGQSASGDLGELGWTITGVTIIPGETNRPGLFQLNTTAVSGTIVRINGPAFTLFTGATNHRVLFVTRLNTNDANTVARVGSMNQTATNPPANGIYFEKLAADTNWFCIARTGGVETRTDSTIAVNTSFTTHTYVRDSVGVRYFINGAEVCSITTNVPSAVNLTPGLQLVNTAAAVKTMDGDYFEMTINGLSR